MASRSGSPARPERFQRHTLSKLAFFRNPTWIGLFLAERLAAVTHSYAAAFARKRILDRV